MSRPRRGAQFLLAAVGLQAAAATPEIAGQTAPFDADEIARIVAHGPWPPPFEPDPTNRVSGKPAAIAFGRHLFFEPRFSPNGYVACVACHQPDRNFTDNRPRARGMAPVERNAVGLQNLRLQRWFGWGGASDSLWMASLRPILDPREIAGSPEKVAFLIRTGDGVACRYRAAFGADPARQDAETVFVNVGKALAAYEETLVTGRTPFDELRDALARGEPAPPTYPVAAQRGLRLFVGRGNCSACHSGPNFTDGEFRATRVPPFVGQSAADTGRYAGVQALRASRLNLLGRYNDDATGASALASRGAKRDGRDRGRWRTPGLRNVAVTAPYLHNGEAASLYDVVRRYTVHETKALRVDDARRLRPADLSRGDVEDLVAFLHTLTDAGGARRPLAPLEESACD